jgi:hypothetical protein
MFFQPYKRTITEIYLHNDIQQNPVAVCRSGYCKCIFSVYLQLQLFILLPLLQICIHYMFRPNWSYSGVRYIVF